ncbi:MBL fold metallo-hydrolase [Bacillus sp. V3B]|uniref:MBL fold metallo-hydrolase n=1 Tax=Bacillus sp. V3B TaxID=2804915 RepID=UPI00210A8A92|nr:MBL fold metallo-hydrolase [Bacillus sp. V3B]MCQ6273709.1 MBL fold metallo-hydrolase [Bacillus sp. V3B]
MEWTQIPLGPVQTNCYILTKEDSSCLIVDPGGEGEKLINFLRERDLKPVGIMLTHAHFDHIGAVDSIREEYKVQACVHVNEKDWLTSSELNCSDFMKFGKVQVREADTTISGEQELTMGSFTFQVFETPGHSPGSVSLYFEDDGIVLSGDALFNGSIGRTDLPGSNHEDLMKSIHEKLLRLPEETVVLCGHGPVTTIGKEMASNPFLHGL